MSITRLDIYEYQCVRVEGDIPKYIRIVVDNNRDPVISDIESRLIDSDHRAFLEGKTFYVTDTFLKKVGSATVFVLETRSDKDESIARAWDHKPEVQNETRGD